MTFGDNSDIWHQVRTNSINPPMTTSSSGSHKSSSSPTSSASDSSSLRNRSDTQSSITTPSESDSETHDLPNIGFAFDIDGVLLHGKTPIPAATKAISVLQGDNPMGANIPFILLTNGGGKTEKDKAHQVAKLIDRPIDERQVVLSHTPMRNLALDHKTVLVVGGEGTEPRLALQAYGFENVVLPKDILAWNPNISPWRHELSEEEKKGCMPFDLDNLKFDAVLIVADSRDYATDMQIILDLLINDGYLMPKPDKSKKENGVQQAPGKSPQLPIFFSQGDIFFANEFPGATRLTQGAFRIAIEAQYKSITGRDLDRTVFGKPEVPAYQFAELALREWARDNCSPSSSNPSAGESSLAARPKTVYMVGDNPKSDIRGGNRYGWQTCLVRTGVYRGGIDENDPEDPASFGVFEDVYDAVRNVVKSTMKA